MKLKVYEPVSFLLAVVWCWHNSNDIKHLRSDTAVIKTWRLMVFAVPFLTSLCLLLKAPCLILLPLFTVEHTSVDQQQFLPFVLRIPGRGQTKVSLVSEVRQDVVYGHGQEV